MGGEIKITGIQVKSLEKARLLSKAIETIEEECGIHEVTITFDRIFVCPWIDLSKLKNTPMEKLIQNLLRKVKR